MTEEEQIKISSLYAEIVFKEIFDSERCADLRKILKLKKWTERRLVNLMYKVDDWWTANKHLFNDILPSASIKRICLVYGYFQHPHVLAGTPTQPKLDIEIEYFGLLKDKNCCSSSTTHYLVLSEYMLMSEFPKSYEEYLNYRKLLEL